MDYKFSKPDLTSSQVDPIILNKGSKKVNRIPVQATTLGYRLLPRLFRSQFLKFAHAPPPFVPLNFSSVYFFSLFFSLCRAHTSLSIFVLHLCLCCVCACVFVLEGSCPQMSSPAKNDTRI
uniref:(northern house mosquito) hypothetical protein n=1 Tax=Culex pipiens TaxID=7175 RepID=A0A8D8A804_CULPI